jgi:hypothetical protein
VLGERLEWELCCSRPMGGGAPVGAARGTGLRPSGTLMLMNPPPAVIRMSRIIGGGIQIAASPRTNLSRDAVHDHRSPRVLLRTSSLADCRPPRAQPPSRNDEGNREGDSLELAPLLKKTTLRRKKANEEHDEGNTYGEGKVDT